VRVAWEGGEGAGWFRVARQGVEPQTDWEVIGESEGHQFWDEDVVPGKVYNYRAHAVNEHGHSEWSNTDTGFAAGGGGDGFRIVGSVKHGEEGLGCLVNLLVVGDDRVTVETGELGNFAFEELDPGLYIVYPHHPEFVFEPAYQLITLTEEEPAGEAHFSASVAEDTFRAYGFIFALVNGDGGPELVPLSNVSVVSWQEGSETEIEVFTNEDGYFLFNDLPAGATLFEPSKAGLSFTPEVHDAMISGEGIPPALIFRGNVVFE
jgi:hypothetical protein